MPWTPWHFQHCTRANTSRPALMRSAVTSGSGGSGWGLQFFIRPARRVVLNPKHQVGRSCLLRVFHCGMFERSKPRVMASKRSWSVGKVPVEWSGT